MKPYDQMTIIAYHSLLSHSIPADMTAPTIISRMYKITLCVCFIKEFATIAISKDAVNKKYYFLIGVIC